jgi:hypothetical protein
MVQRIIKIIIITINSTRVKADLTFNPSPKNLTPNPSPFGVEGKEFKVLLHFD